MDENKNTGQEEPSSEYSGSSTTVGAINQPPFDPSSIYPDADFPSPQGAMLGKQASDSGGVQVSNGPGFFRTNGRLLLVAAMIVGGPILIAIPMGAGGFGLVLFSAVALIGMVLITIFTNVFLGFSSLSKYLNVGLSSQLVLSYLISISVAVISLFAIVVLLGKEGLAYSTVDAYRILARSFVAPAIVLAGILSAQSLKTSEDKKQHKGAAFGLVVAAGAALLLGSFYAMTYTLGLSPPKERVDSAFPYYYVVSSTEYEVSGEATYGLTGKEITVRPKGTTGVWVKTYYEITDQKDDCTVKESDCALIGETTNGRLYKQGQRTSKYGNKERLFYLFSDETVEATITFINKSPSDEEALAFAKGLRDQNTQ